MTKALQTFEVKPAYEDLATPGATSLQAYLKRVHEMNVLAAIQVSAVLCLNGQELQLTQESAHRRRTRRPQTRLRTSWRATGTQSGRLQSGRCSAGLASTPWGRRSLELRTPCTAPSQVRWQAGGCGTERPVACAGPRCRRFTRRRLELALLLCLSSWAKAVLMWLASCKPSTLVLGTTERRTNSQPDQPGQPLQSA